MTTSKRLSLGIVALSVLAAGCTSAGIAATVDGAEISDSDVRAIRIEADDATSLSAEAYRGDLTRLIITEAMVSAAETDFGITGLGTPEVQEEYLASIGPQEQQILESVAQDPALGPAAFDTVVTQLALRSEVRAALAADEELLVGIWQEDRNVLVEVCVSHILVATTEEAEAVLARLEAGESFADVANEVSLDTQSPNGALPCPVSPSAFVGAFADAAANAPVGEVTGPIETEFGWHVIVVDSRETPQTFEEFAADPQRWVPSEFIDPLWNAWIDDVVGRADIEVRSPIGTWYPPVDGIVPPPPSP